MEADKEDGIWNALIGTAGGIIIGLIVGYFIYSPNKSQQTEEVNKESVRQAIVCAERDYIMRGSVYRAKIILADIDTSLQYKCKVGSRTLENGNYVVCCGRIGNFSYNGQIEVEEPNGTITQYPFSQNYTVTEPIACVSSLVLLAGKENPIAISAPGIPDNDLSVEVSGGICTKKGLDYYIKPDAESKTCKVSIYANLDGKRTILNIKKFDVVK